MNAVTRGARNAFRNATRTISVVVILGLAIGLSFVMLVAHHTVSDKVASTLSSVGNTVNIGPPGYSAGMHLGKFLTIAELAPIAHLNGVTSLDEYFNGAVKASDLPPSNATGAGSTQITPKRVGGHGSGGAAPSSWARRASRTPRTWRSPRRASLVSRNPALLRSAPSRSTSPDRPSRRPR